MSEALLGGQGLEWPWEGGSLGQEMPELSSWNEWQHLEQPSLPAALGTDVPLSLCWAGGGGTGSGSAASQQAVLGPSRAGAVW